MSGVLNAGPPDVTQQQDPFVDASADEPKSDVVRERPEPDPARKAAVTQWIDRVKAAEKFYEQDFKQMQADMAFAYGVQWEGQNARGVEKRYIANITLRHISQRTNALYARNPRVIARRKERLDFTLWDGTIESLQAAMQGASAGDPNAMLLLAEVQQVKQQQALMERFGKTLELLFKHELAEQNHPFVRMMKEMVRRAVTTGVGYVKVGFQRLTRTDPEIERQIADVKAQLDEIQAIAADLADKKIEPDSARADLLQTTLKSLAEKAEIIVREGLVFDYPDSNALIPSTDCKKLNGFVGASWVAERYFLHAEDIQKVYGVDVRGAAKTYTMEMPLGVEGEMPVFRQSDVDADSKLEPYFCVYEVYSPRHGVVFPICDGWPDYLREPSPPVTNIERFYPWFVCILNEFYWPGRIFPKSDVALIRDMQLDHNRARQGLREHRVANRPKMAVAAGKLEDADKDKLRDHPANALIELRGLQQGEKVSDVLQKIEMPGVDPNLYDVSPSEHDVLRVTGNQEANLGGTSDSTATETSIAESSRLQSVDAQMAEMDLMLSEMAGVGGQILLKNVTEDTVKRVVGTGAVWPVFSLAELAEQVYLEVEAGSAGRPNQAAEIQKMTQVFPLLLQIPGVQPEWLAKQLLTRMDENVKLEDAYLAGMPSIQALNEMSKAPASAPIPSDDPEEQGEQGHANAPKNGGVPKPNGPGPRTPTAPGPEQAMTTMPGQPMNGAPAPMA